jgi:glycerol kinase
MPASYILALDQGTTSSRAILFDQSGHIRQVAQKEFRQYYPQPGWVEHDPEEIWSSQYGVLAEVLAKSNCTTRDIAAIGITNQRETVIVWDRVSGKPIHPAIVWQDRRTAGYCDKLKAQGLSGMIRDRTGLVIDAYFSATKLRWILDEVPGARARADKGELAFGTVDSWLVWKLTGGQLHITDSTNASRTLLLNIHTGAWDPELLRLFDIPSSVLPEVRSSSEIYGPTGSIMAPGSVGMPIAGIAGDQQAALFGQ